MLHVTLLSLLFLQPQTIEPAKQFAPAKKGWTRTQITYADQTVRAAKQTRSREEYVHFSQEAKQVVAKMTEVAANQKERSDLRAIAFMLREFNEAVHANNYQKADIVWDRMSVAMARGRGVAAVAEKRKAEWKRADEERRHREELRQRERHHQEQMARQRALADQIRMLNGR